MSEDDVMVSLILAEGQTEPDYLEILISAVKAGQSIELDEPADSELRRAARQYLNIVRHQRPVQRGARRSAPPGQPKAGGSSMLAAGLRLVGFGLGLVPIAVFVGLVIVMHLLGIVHTDPASDWPSFLRAFYPPAAGAVVYLSFNICRFENQRWVRNFRGASSLTRSLVEASAGFAWLFSWAWLAAFLYHQGWQQTVGLMVISQLTVLLWSLFSRDHLILWLAATVLLWPLFVLLSLSVSWFGLMRG